MFERLFSTTTFVVVGIQWATTTKVVVGIERVTTTTVVVGIKWVKFQTGKTHKIAKIDTRHDQSEIRKKSGIF